VGLFQICSSFFAAALKFRFFFCTYIFVFGERASGSCFLGRWRVVCEELIKGNLSVGKKRCFGAELHGVEMMMIRGGFVPDLLQFFCCGTEI